MLELLNGGGGGGLFYPNSGPGSKYLQYGTPTLGFFGTVSAAEMFSNYQLYEALDFWSGEGLADAGEWLKYMFNNRVCFTPKKELRMTVSWNQLYNAGLVYGTDDNGVFPVGTGVKQMRVLTKETDFFKVRLFRGSPIDPATVVSGTYPEGLRESEWLRFIASIAATPPAGYTGPAWKLFPNADLTNGKSIHMQETNAANTANALFYTNALYTVSHLPKTTENTGYAWRPVLELIDGSNVLMNVSGVTADLIGLKPLSLNELDYDDVLYPIRLILSDLYGQSALVLTEGEPYNYAISPDATNLDYTISSLQPLVLTDSLIYE